MFRYDECFHREKINHSTREPEELMMADMTRIAISALFALLLVSICDTVSTHWFLAVCTNWESLSSEDETLKCPNLSFTTRCGAKTHQSSFFLSCHLSSSWSFSTILSFCVGVSQTFSAEAQTVWLVNQVLEEFQLLLLCCQDYSPLFLANWNV